MTVWAPLTAVVRNSVQVIDHATRRLYSYYIQYRGLHETQYNMAAVPAVDWMASSAGSHLPCCELVASSLLFCASLVGWLHQLCCYLLARG